MAKILLGESISVFCAMVENPRLGAIWREDSQNPKATIERISTVRPPPLGPHKSLIFKRGYLCPIFSAESEPSSSLDYKALSRLLTTSTGEATTRATTIGGDQLGLTCPDVAQLCIAATDTPGGGSTLHCCNCSLT